jgi:hypothetical protein
LREIREKHRQGYSTWELGDKYGDAAVIEALGVEGVARSIGLPVDDDESCPHGTVIGYCPACGEVGRVF